MTVGPGHEELKAPSTRTSAAWTMTAAAAFGVLLMLIFILQNPQRATVNFLWLHGNIPLGTALLLAAVIGALVVSLLAAARLLQLRLVARRHRRSADSGAGQP